ncbi:hypothetical protein SKAU_G00084900 [Synaphobranchus kaupii]|uniref:Uncharacterized protein n=1 Tax=Synaphobranchus kaupii TaxID=118154 RepID=A0A9Q1J4U5_SYNKA|nr:hypothetical protein SKAU_G00084900 [Synaphobranchus kaupii]
MQRLSPSTERAGPGSSVEDGRCDEVVYRGALDRAVLCTRVRAPRLLYLRAVSGERSTPCPTALKMFFSFGAVISSTASQCIVGKGQYRARRTPAPLLRAYTIHLAFSLQGELCAAHSLKIDGFTLEQVTGTHLSHRQTGNRQGDCGDRRTVERKLKNDVVARSRAWAGPPSLTASRRGHDDAPSRGAWDASATVRASPPRAYGKRKKPRLSAGAAASLLRKGYDFRSAPKPATARAVGSQGHFRCPASPLQPCRWPRAVGSVIRCHVSQTPFRSLCSPRICPFVRPVWVYK